MRRRSAVAFALVMALAASACAGPFGRSKPDAYAIPPDACTLLDDGVVQAFLGAGAAVKPPTIEDDPQDCVWKRADESPALTARWESLATFVLLYRTDSKKSGEERAKAIYAVRITPGYRHKCKVAADECRYRVIGRQSTVDPPRVDVLVRKDNVILQGILDGDLVTVNQPETMAPVATRLATSLTQRLG
ncbi:hypothetical protein [Spirillospora sp. CA-128828]|uniref:hypothetical protein n=1 Tax=Spirillospora sp. CA-128828 TaxID=3240033 RepID=UPI003D90E790